MTFLAVAAGLAVAQGGSTRHVPRTTHSTSKPSSVPASMPGSRPTTQVFGPQLRGFSIQMPNGGEDHPYSELVGDISKTGANCVKLVVAAYQENCSSVLVKVDPARTPSDKKLKQVVADAHKDGMKVVLMPIVLLANPRDGEWRGKIDPKAEDGGWDKWWESYTEYVLHYATVSQDAGVDLFMVGSELISTEKQLERWQTLIAKVRKVYAGKLSYSANWDHYRPVKYWDKLDVVGMTSYYDLVGDDKPTREKLMETWAGIRKEILDWQKTVDRPVLFTEVGWPNQVTAAKYPWDYYRSQDKPDPAQQKLCFETFFDSFGNLPEVAGILVWEWCNNPDQDTSPEKDTGYCPKDKPAMDVIKAFFKQGTATVKK